MKKGIFFFFTAFYIFFSLGRFNSVDHVCVYQTTKNIIEHGSLGSSEFAYFLQQGADGKWYGIYGIGQSILSIPLYLIGKLVEKYFPLKWQDIFKGVNYGYFGGEVTIFTVSLFCQIITPLILIIFYLFCQRLGCSKKKSLILVFVLGVSTILWSNSRDYFQHPLETLLLLSSIYILFYKDNLSPIHFFFSGLLLGYAVLTRPMQVINFFPLVVYGYFRTPNEPIISKLKKYIIPFIIPFVIGVIGVLLVNYIRFRDIFKFGYSEANNFNPNYLFTSIENYLFSVGHGIFIYSPPLLIGVLCFKSFLKRFKKEAYLFLSIITINLLFYSSFPNIHNKIIGYGMWSYGPRYLLFLTPLLLLPVIFIWNYPKQFWYLFWITVIAGIIIQIPAILVSYPLVLNEYLPNSSKVIIMNPAIYHPFYSLPVQSIIYFFKNKSIDIWLFNKNIPWSLFPFLVCLSILLFSMLLGLYLMKRNLKYPETKPCC